MNVNTANKETQLILIKLFFMAKPTIYLPINFNLLVKNVKKCWLFQVVDLQNKDTYTNTEFFEKMKCQYIDISTKSLIEYKIIFIIL